MKVDNVHMVKAAFHAQFKTAMENCGLSAGYYFNKVKLPTEVDDAEGLLPEKPFWQLINMVAIQEGLPDFGSRVAQVLPWHKVESLGPLLLGSSNLKQLLTTFCNIASSQSSNARFTLKKDGTVYWFRYTASPYFNYDIQMELYRITSMIQLVQLSTGARWRPEVIKLLMPETRVVDACPLLTNSKIYFSQMHSAFTIQEELLQLPVVMGISTMINKANNSHPEINSQFESAIRQIINVNALTNNFGIEDVASITGMSVRSLQRRLATQGLKFKDMLGCVKFTYAKDRLRDTRMLVKEVAESLGYSDSAHFTRAFLRWSGSSPTDFRELR
jgi:AraC-like DNA-binding protein